MRELAPQDLRRQCSAEEFDFRTTAEVRPRGGMIGQGLALKSLRTGIEIRKPGYNIFVSGPKTSGRTTLIRECFRRCMPGLPSPVDRVYVNNFSAPYRPTLLEFPPGKGEDYVADLDKLIAAVRDRVARLVHEEGPRSRFAALRGRFERRKQRIRDAFERRAKRDGFIVGHVRTHEGVRPDLFYLHDKKPLAMAELEELAQTAKFPAGRLSAIGRSYEARMGEFGSALARLTQLDQEFARELVGLERARIETWLREAIERLRRSYPYPRVRDHLVQLQDAILNRLHIFRPRPQDGTPEGEERDRFREFRGNLLFTRGAAKGPPVVYEKHPTFSNLFGFVERPAGDDGGFSDFLDVRPGSILEADQGFLVLSFSDVLQSAPLWNALKNTLRAGTLAIHEPEGQSSPAPALKPEPIPLDVKVILVGEPYLFDIVYDVDPDFRNLFKIRVDLEPDFPLSRRLVRHDFPGFVARVCRTERLLPVSREAMALLVEEGVRLAGRVDKFTACLGKLIDVVREADWCARRTGARLIGPRHVERGVDQAIERVNIIERRINEAIASGSIMIQTKGKRVGQINGLAVYDVGDYAFGKPARITVETSVGRGGIINIERESGMSGGSHDKGVHILTGYLRARFAQTRPLSLTASICFEQSYSAIDGDSASSTEMYAILSSLSGLPIRQDIAVTGSVNQKGEIQAIGDVNEKIEGFFQVTRASRSRTGDEGVIIPDKNVRELMLRREVVEAVRRGSFHIWAVRTVEEGIAILTGVPAGRRLRDGTYTRGSVFDRVDRRLEELVRGLKKYPIVPVE